MTRRGLVLFALLSVLWSLSYLLSLLRKIAVADVSTSFLVLVRAAVGALAPLRLRMSLPYA